MVVWFTQCIWNVISCCLIWNGSGRYVWNRWIVRNYFEDSFSICLVLCKTLENFRHVSIINEFYCIEIFSFSNLSFILLKNGGLSLHGNMVTQQKHGWKCPFSTCWLIVWFHELLAQVSWNFKMVVLTMKDSVFYRNLILLKAFFLTAHCLISVLFLKTELKSEKSYF
jgi:hypothetical protein